MSQHDSRVHSGDAAAHSAQTRTFQQAMAGRSDAKLTSGGGAGPASTASSTSPTSFPPSSSPPSSSGTTSTFHSAHDAPHATKTPSNSEKDGREKGWRWGPARMEKGDEGGHA
ncbi:hypothetical protein NBRC10512_007880 [Rhodotorula toruloides]|uniref:RHTO0S04e04808g1_1 n=2 Tax=Rhodotorula toruloides TaxID=5286 RepID=A0A061AVL3_RHOTO|nr:uncharacterized protein RHTO_01966 [Rhodotorula toruloides NP11]EMS21096.1 hypothetical protein RHTO_01966 [Rhodotorula toruloides NP11]CDR39406.1 RHTO0S04e04808g1_1 [Rhodotorula toruloides]